MLMTARRGGKKIIKLIRTTTYTNNLKSQSKHKITIRMYVEINHHMTIFSYMFFNMYSSIDGGQRH